MGKNVWNGKYAQIFCFPLSMSKRDRALAHRPTVKKLPMRTTHVLRYSNQIFRHYFRCSSANGPIHVWTYNVSINMLGIYEINQYVNLQLLSINSTERVDELLLERERYCTVSCHCGCTI